MQAYFLAVNLFALMALLVGLNNFSKNADGWLLLPLLLLAAVRAVIVILFLFFGSGPAQLISALDVFSTFCVVWSLMPQPRRLPPVVLGFGAVGGVLMSLLPLLPNWPIPAPMHSVVVAMVGLPFVFFSLTQLSRPHLIGPLLLAVANFFALLAMPTLGWLLLLLAYTILTVALYRDGERWHFRRQAQSEAAAQQATLLGRERQRLLDVSRIISAIPSLEQSMAHVVRSVGTVTGADQAAIAVLDATNPGQFFVPAVYSPERPVTLTGRFREQFSLAESDLLQTVIADQNQVQLGPQDDPGALAQLFGLWFEERIGPLYVQTLSVHGQPVGVLLLGNPVMQSSISPQDVALCRHLGPQIAAQVESFRQLVAVTSNIVTTPAPELATEPALVAEPAADAGAIGVTVSAKPVSALPLAVTTEDLPAFSKIDDASHGAILETIHEGVVVSDTTGRVRLVNRAAERILGKSRRELMGQPIATIYGQIDSTEAIEQLASVFSRQNQPLPTFAEYDGRYVQGQLMPWRNERREWLGIIAVFRDVTHNVKADQARNNFISALSRELRAPLTTIKGYSELILRGALTDYSAEQLHIQQIIHSGVDRMVAVLDNAIQLGVQNKNKMVPHFQQLNVGPVIDEVLEAVASLAQLHELTLSKEIKTDLPPITADRQHLYHILQNLLENACQFTPPGGYVSVRAWVQHERAGNSLRPELNLMVADNGVGIPSTEFKRIFEPFYQISGVLDSGGMGMGLTVVKELVEMHKGRVWVESVVNEGSVFQVALPLSQD